MKRVVVLVAAALIVLVAFPSFASGDAWNRSTGGLASSAPTPDAGGGTVVANITVGNGP